MTSKQFRRNIEKEFLRQKYLNLDAKYGCHDFLLILDNLKPNYNIGKIFRSAHVFGAKEVYVIGTKYFDPGPSKGSFKYVPTKFVASTSVINDITASGYSIFSFDAKGKHTLGNFQFPKKSAFLFGNEGLGLSSQPGETIAIPQFSEMESLNVSIAASIAMFEYVRQQYGNKNFSNENNLAHSQAST